MEVMISTPYYRLKTLITEKYGQSRFDLGCRLVASWLKYDVKLDFSKEDIDAFCNTNLPGVRFTPSVAISLKNLFKLQSIKELFTHPENININEA